MRFIGLWSGKIILLILNIFGKSGSALPGLVAEKISPKLMQYYLKKLPDGVVVVTGTNGKTTTTKMLSHILSSEKKVLTNPSGSNFTRGVVSSIVKNTKWSGKLDFDIAVIELDEAYAVKFSEKYRPDYTVILNIMRDQMDRFGEIDNTRKLLSKVVDKTTKMVILNGDDPRVVSLSESARCSVVYFGASSKLRDVLINDDELHSGNIEKRKHQVEAELIGLDKESLEILVDNKALKFNFKLIGLHNAQNACVAIMLALKLGISVDKITSQIESLKPAFGRGELININGKKIILQLVKNPGGFRQSLISGAQIDVDHSLLVINDNYADGRDVSWLWDVNLKGFLNGLIYTAGSRGLDMALRLRYDDIVVNETYTSLKRAVDKQLNILPQSGSLMIYTTYTAMLDLRKILANYTKVEKV